MIASSYKAQPEWDKLDIPHLDPLPAIRRKLGNLQKLKDANPDKLQAQLQKLHKRIG